MEEPKSLLEHLYNGWYASGLLPVPDSAEITQKHARAKILHDLIGNEMNPEILKLCEELAELHRDIDYSREEIIFAQGLRMGARLMLEIFDKA